MLDDEAPQVPAPELVQVVRQWTTDPRQPERLRWQVLTGQPLDLDSDHGEGAPWCGAGVELGPGVHRHLSVDRVRHRCRVIRRAMRARVPKTEAGAMQARPAAALIGSGSPEEHPMRG